MTSICSESISERCTMRLIIFLAKDEYFCLSKNSVLQHHGHTFIPPNAILQYGEDLDQKETYILEVMYNHWVNNSTIETNYPN